MKFCIKHDAFTVGEQCHGTIPVKLAGIDRMLFLKPSAEPLLQTFGWVDFSEFTVDADRQLRRDFEDALTALECFELAEIEGRNIPSHNGCCVAGEKDYAAVSDFMQAYVTAGFSFSPIEDLPYYSLDNVRIRQFNNKDYHFMKIEDGELLAVLVMNVPASDDVSSVATFSSVVFHDSLEENTCRSFLKDLLDFAAFEFAGEFNRFRFLYTNEKQKHILTLLQEYGFKKICTLEREILKHTDLVIYDCEME